MKVERVPVFYPDDGAFGKDKTGGFSIGLDQPACSQFGTTVVADDQDQNVIQITAGDLLKDRLSGRL